MLPVRLTRDKAYDLDALDKQNGEYGIEMIAPTGSIASMSPGQRIAPALHKAVVSGDALRPRTEPYTLVAR